MDISKREQIREGLRDIELQPSDLRGFLEGHTHMNLSGVDKILSYLHKENVVIKKETNVETDGFGLVGATVQRMVGAGYTLTEPLLEE